MPFENNGEKINNMVIKEKRRAVSSLTTIFEIKVVQPGTVPHPKKSNNVAVKEKNYNVKFYR